MKMNARLIFSILEKITVIRNKHNKCPHIFLPDFLCHCNSTHIPNIYIKEIYCTCFFLQRFSLSHILYHCVPNVRQILHWPDPQIPSHHYAAAYYLPSATYPTWINYILDRPEPNYNNLFPCFYPNSLERNDPNETSDAAHFHSFRSSHTNSKNPVLSVLCHLDNALTLMRLCADELLYHHVLSIFSPLFTVFYSILCSEIIALPSSNIRCNRSSNFESSIFLGNFSTIP